ncbi:G-box-binding factor 1 [Spatholobus suberectus]|nr:G-box-binding factor 1 [Spatholobus suberectus]
MGAGEESTTKPSKSSSSTQVFSLLSSCTFFFCLSFLLCLLIFSVYGSRRHLQHLLILIGQAPCRPIMPAGATPPPFFASTVASPTPHPYLWGSQHPLMPPYGTPVPYSAIYPPGSIYAHPSMAVTPSVVQQSTEVEGKGPDGKDRDSSKKLKGTSANTVSKAGESGKAGSGSGNDGISQSDESGSEGSSNASEENTNQQESATNKKGSFDRMLVDGANAQNNSAGAISQSSVPGKPVVSMPATNLNIGMDLWNASSGGAEAAKMRHNQSGAPGVVILGDQWIQDERELKRQKRKQSNRESARRSRLRKQAECEDLQKRVETLASENRTIREELQRLSEDCEKLTSENNSIKEELERLCGPEAVANLE